MTVNETISYFIKKYGRLPQQGHNDHYLAVCRIASLLEFFYYEVKLEQEAKVDILGALPTDEFQEKEYKIDIVAVYPRKRHKGHWTIRYDNLAIEILNKYKKGGKTGHKSKKAYQKDQTRKREILSKYAHSIFVEFDARDISQVKRWQKLGIYTILEELGITLFPYPNNNKKETKIILA